MRISARSAIFGGRVLAGCRQSDQPSGESAPRCRAGADHRVRGAPPSRRRLRLGPDGGSRSRRVPGAARRAGLGCPHAGGVSPPRRPRSGQSDGARDDGLEGSLPRTPRGRRGRGWQPAARAFAHPGSATGLRLPRRVADHGLPSHGRSLVRSGVRGLRLLGGCASGASGRRRPRLLDRRRLLDVLADDSNSTDVPFRLARPRPRRLGDDRLRASRGSAGQRVPERRRQ